MNDLKKMIDEKKINELIERTKNPSHSRVSQILDRSLDKKGLSLEDASYLLNAEDKESINKLYETASKIKEDIYGKRLVFFAPLYVSNKCINDCSYCGFRASNNFVRKKLTLDEVREQVRALEEMGHKRLLLEFGEHMENDIGYVTEVIKEIYNTKSGKGEIRRVNVNIAATTVEDYKKLKQAGIGTYQLFQETYHKPTYKKLHKGPKADFERQLLAHDRAFEAGIDDVGLGVLFGLYDYKFETIGLLSHAKHLEDKFNIGPHTFSVPRWQPSDNIDFNPPYQISEKEILKIIAVLRVSVPYTGIIISTRESPETRAKAFEIGVSQTSAASITVPGGYGKPIDEKRGQFSLSDHRGVNETIFSVLKQGLLPSFCTACYRKSRTGKTFMELAKPGEIQKYCLPNAILTFKEYLEDYATKEVRNIGLEDYATEEVRNIGLEDYATKEVRKIGEEIIEKSIEQIKNNNVKKKTELKLKLIENGHRDLFF